MRSKLAMLLAIAVCVTALWAAWGPEEQLTSSDPYGNSGPNIVVGTNNYRHLLWASRNHANVLRLYKRWYPETGWTSTYTIKSPAKYCTGNYAIALDGNGTSIHVVWQAYDPGRVIDTRAYYAKCVPGKTGTGGWGQSICLTPDRRTSCVDVAGFSDRVAVAFNQTDPAIGFKECIAGTWQPTEHIYVPFGKPSQVSIAADPQNRHGDVYILFSVGDKVYVTRRLGDEWQDPELALACEGEEGYGSSYGATIEVDPTTGCPHIVSHYNVYKGTYQGPRHIYSTYWDPVLGWHGLEMISDPSALNSRNPRMCFSDGSVYAVWADEADGIPGIVYRVRTDGTWGTPGWVTSGYDDGSPDIAPAPGSALYCVWSDGRSSPVQIWGSPYTSGSFGGQAADLVASDRGFALDAGPNPCSRGTVVRYSLPAAADVALRLYDASGALAKTVASGSVDAGQHTASLSAQGLTRGVYILKLEAGSDNLTRKLVIN